MRTWLWPPLSLIRLNSPRSRVSGTPGIQRHGTAFLSALFERIHVKDRKVIGYTPRIDRAKRVKVLIAAAFDYAEDGPGAASGTPQEQRVKGI